ncbi:hypothetical protein SPJ2_0452 [Streptococcus parauberis KRS-02109]|nr:hypothetical protein SPJ2_0452 [Streptococcus parauberis KRS-02109]
MQTLKHLKKFKCFFQKEDKKKRFEKLKSFYFEGFVRALL